MVENIVGKCISKGYYNEIIIIKYMKLCNITYYPDHIRLISLIISSREQLSEIFV